MVGAALLTDRVLLDGEGIDALLAELRHRGYQVIGPTRRWGAVVLDEIASTADLPRGWGDEQGPGTYRLVDRADGAWFGFTVGPASWRRFLVPPRQTVWRARLGGGGFEPVPAPDAPPRYAFIGVRGCDLAAIATQDAVLRDGPHPDPWYGATREAAFVVAADCAHPAATCFCASVGTGPAAGPGHDLAVTELIDADRHVAVVRAGSARGAEVLAAVPHTPATDADIEAAEILTRHAAAAQVRSLPGRSTCADLAARPEHPGWAEVAERCLSCTNCTLVCPTCFCSAMEDRTDLAGTEAWRERRWDSCFSLDHSFIHGGSVRTDVRARYRQWLTHKLATWWDQFGTSGCVGCGRCITWCPAGIDLTAEVRRITDAPSQEGATP